MKIEWDSCIKVGLSVFLLYLGIYYWDRITQIFYMLVGAAFPLIVGCAIAYLVNILMSFYEKYYFVESNKPIAVKSRRPVCMAGAFATLLAIVVMIIRLIVPQLVSCVQLIFAQLPGFIELVIDEVAKMNIFSENVMDTLAEEDWNSRIGQIIKFLTSGIGNVMDMLLKTISSVFSAAVTGLLAIIFSIYLLLGKDKLKNQCNILMDAYLNSKWKERIKGVLSIMNDSFHRYIVGQCIEAVIIGVLCTLGMMLLGLPYPTMIGALIAFTALIPVAGAYIGAGVGAFMIVMVSPIEAIIFLVFIVILQQLEGNIIYPRVVGSSIGLPGIWVLAAVTIGGGVMGVVGMLLGVPLTATVYSIIRKDVINRKSKRRENK